MYLCIPDSRPSVRRYLKENRITCFGNHEIDKCFIKLEADKINLKILKVKVPYYGEGDYIDRVIGGIHNHLIELKG